MKKWLNLPWYIILLPLFYVLHVYNQYFCLISAGVFFTYLFYYLAFSILLFGVGLLFFKDRTRAGAWTALFLCIFFFFGAFHDFLKTLGLPSLLVSYKFILSLVLILLVLITIRLKKGNTPFRLQKFLSILFTALLILEAGISLFYIFTNHKRKMDLAGDNEPLTINLPKADSKDPDIFFFVFDEYTSSKALQKYYHFNNNAFDSSLVQKGFYISTGSQSNYNSTPLSIASTFNMQYFNRPLETVPNDTYSLLQGAYSLKKSFLPALLGKKGYEIINYGLCNIEGHPVTVTPVFREYEAKPLLLGTLWGRIQRDIIWNLIVRLPGDNEKLPEGTSYIERNRKNYADFFSELKKESTRPRFVVGHVLFPRRPAYFDRYGNTRVISMADFTDDHHDSLYKEQVLYANRLIDSLAVAANSPRARPLVLIVEGDHGNRYAEWGRHIREKQFMNLNVYYFSDRDYSLLYDSISPVNSFRVVLNKYFDTGLPLVKDSTILLN
jgi:hypothetical protein